MLKRFFLAVVWVVVYPFYILVAMVVGVSNSQRVVEILNWPDEVCERLEQISLFEFLLVVASLAATTVAVNLIWSMWHVEHTIFATTESKVGCTIAGLFIYLAGLALFFIAIRRGKNPGLKKKLFNQMFRL